MSLRVTKAHAYGNDFLLVAGNPAQVTASGGPSGLARALCNRQCGIGADGLIFYDARHGATAMHLYNADGSSSELSGNGLRCLAALLVRAQLLGRGVAIAVDTAAGQKTLELLGNEGARYTFRTALGQPGDIRQVAIAAGDELLTASVLRLGNPQCVILGPLPDRERFNRLGPALATHTMFPAGTNVEFAHVETQERVRILIWERGVGPTPSSGTGASASAVAAVTHGGAARALEVIAPGGTQTVEWRDDGVYLPKLFLKGTGWAITEGDPRSEPSMFGLVLFPERFLSCQARLIATPVGPKQLRTANDLTAWRHRRYGVIDGGEHVVDPLPES